MKTLTEQYQLIKKDKGHKGVFLKEARKQFPNLVTNSATFEEASTILKQKGIISENFVGLDAINGSIARKKESYETAFEKFLQEAETKAEEKKVSKEVEEDLSKNYDQRDEKDPNNMIFGQIQMGYYCELKDPKNEGKTDQELLEMVYKNLAKDPIFYTKNGQFGVKDLGYTDEAPSLGEPKEPKGPHKSSGYGNLKEHSISLAGGIVTGTGFTSANYMDFFGLNEDEKTKENTEDVKDLTAAMKELGNTAEETKEKVSNLEEDEINENIDPEVFQRLDSLMPLPILESFLESITTAYNEMQSAEESARDLKDDDDVYEFGPGPLLDYLVIQSQNAVGRDSDEKLIKSLVRMAMLGGKSSF